MILRGAYVESLGPNKAVYRSVGHMAYRNRKVFHKILKVLSSPVITLAICVGEYQNWGFKVGKEIVSNEVYRAQKHKARRVRKNKAADTTKLPEQKKE